MNVGGGWILYAQGWWCIAEFHKQLSIAKYGMVMSGGK